MTFEISKEVEFDLGHRVPNHKSKCRNPHGHRYRVRVTITGELVTIPGASNEGMLADFGDLKTWMKYQIEAPLDHAFAVYEGDKDMMFAFQMEQYSGMDGRRTEWTSKWNWKVVVFPFIPTAENLAKWTYDQLTEHIEAMGFKMSKVELWETPTSLAVYQEG